MGRRGMLLLGNELPVQGDMLQVGQSAPEFALTANNWRTKRLADYAGKIKIISTVPSLDTSVCSAQTRRFNQEASGLRGDVVVLTMSADLPYAQARWCAAEGIERVETLSDHKTMAFADAYGVHVVESRIMQRAVFVVDAYNVVRHVEYVYNIDDQPRYDVVISIAKGLTE
jgi:thiol peroxidase